jgi:DNA-3-methyladenine glycosylase II
MKLYSLQGKLFPTPPFDFSKSLHFAGMFTPTQGEQNISGLSFTRAVYLKDQTIAFRLEDRGTIEEPFLHYTLFSHEKIEKEIESALLDRIKFFLSLDDDLKLFYTLGREDPEFAPIVEDLYGLHQVKFLTPFEAACWAVLGQRISIKVAHIMKDRLVKAVGDVIEIDGVDYWTFPTAGQIEDLGLEKVISLLKNQRKSEYIIAVAEAFSGVDENFLRKAPVEEVREWLMNIRGIGEWSAHLELIRGLGRMEELSEHDRMLFECTRKIYGAKTSEEQLNKIADDYGEFKGYWAYYIRTGC